jgi:DNA-binding MarR family transcriptional regulator
MISDYDVWASLDASGFAVYRLRELELAPLRMTVAQASVLRVLETAGPLTARMLRDLTLRQQNTISIIVARMAASGLVEITRMRGERESRISITGEGHELLGKLPTHGLCQVFSVLGSVERNALSRYLRSLSDRAGALLTPEGPAFMRYITARDTALSGGGEAVDAPSEYLLWTLLDGTRFAISRLRELELGTQGLTVEQASLLRVLAETGRSGQSPTTRQIEDVTLRQHNSISVLVGRIVKAGLAAREKVGGERSSRITLTPAGRALLSSLTNEALSLTFSVLSESEKPELMDYLRSLNRNARQMLRHSVVAGPAVGTDPAL